MTKIIFVGANGGEQVVDASPGLTVMEAAVKNGIAGIEAECGGACACATCHVYVDPAWQSRVGGRGDMEEALLELADGVQPNSRLSCQITITDELDGIVLRIPASND